MRKPICPKTGAECSVGILTKEQCPAFEPYNVRPKKLRCGSCGMELRDGSIKTMLVHKILEHLLRGRM